MGTCGAVPGRAGACSLTKLARGRQNPAQPSVRLGAVWQSRRLNPAVKESVVSSANNDSKVANGRVNR